MRNFKKSIFRLLMMITVVIITGSCKKDNTQKLTDLLYDLTVDGNEVTFKTVTTGISAYRWDFGDGSSSTEANPVHEYPGKGKYVTTLYATMNGKVVEASTVIRIAKTSPVKLDDNTLGDWDNVTANVLTAGPNGGIFRSAKFDYDGNYIYIFAEMNSKKANGDIFDFYIDADNSAATGLLSAYTDGGFDILLEGQLLTSGLDIFYHKGPQNSFTFDPQSISEAYTVGTITEAAGILKFEMRIARGKLKGLTGSGMRIGIMATKNDWSVTLGSIPDAGASAFLLDMSE
ncbi:PKD domain-containing protein [Pedobacter nyackensis]|uniref:PKD domain-containing protein n=1 Tax=Pedobacter nyackensis TaxID=475255 RepID=UPI00292DC01F|nr:PKD domain-containing protein [Pedobacter nyackensis]